MAAAGKPSFLSQLGTFDSSVLRPTETIVTQRNGKQFVERKTSDGYEVEFKGVADVPDFSDRAPSSFDASTGKWSPITHDERSALRLKAMDTLSLVTYNVWFADEQWEARCDALAAKVAALKPHIVCLQEVTPRFWERLLAQEWVRSGYLVSDPNGASVFPYGVAILTWLQVAKLKLTKLPTNMGRRVLLCEFRLEDGETFAVATAHLESRDNADFRIDQMGIVFPLIESFTHAIFCGDFNFGPGHKENAHIPADYIDSWVAVKGIEPGLTCGDRIDRVLVRSPTLIPADITMLGVEEAAEGRLCPSDHFGLHCVFGAGSSSN